MAVQPPRSRNQRWIPLTASRSVAAGALVGGLIGLFLGFALGYPLVICAAIGAGIGARPTAATGITGVDAFVWIKPPGESDGISQAGVPDVDDPFTVFDPMCDPAARTRYGNYPTNAAPDAPHAGHFFPAYFADLVRNAHPPIR